MMENESQETPRKGTRAASFAKAGCVALMLGLLAAAGAWSRRTLTSDFCAEWWKGEKKVPLSDGTALVLKRVKAGSFWMGSPMDENNRASGEKLHRVTLTRNFWIGQTEVTQGQFKAVMGMTPAKKEEEMLPVGQLSWNSAMEFCRRLTEQEQRAGRLPKGYEFTLPTEAQWEYAARGGRRGRGFIYSGSDDSSLVAWTNENSEYKPHPVGLKAPNELGLYDMSGNAVEWCWDYAAPYDGDAIDPMGPPEGDAHIARGGTWYLSARACRSAYRIRFADAGTRYYDFGFRVVLDRVRTRHGMEEQEMPEETAGEAAAGPVTAVEELPPDLLKQLTIPLSTYRSLTMVLVEPGTFQMGLPEGVVGIPDRNLLHTVTLTRHYWIGQTEVTLGQFDDIMKRLPNITRNQNTPVNSITKWQAMQACWKLTERAASEGWLPEGYEFMLPTDAQWEYAARGGRKSRGTLYSGSNTLDDVAWHKGNGKNKLHEVGQKLPNELGLYDMSGNVEEWTLDNWDYPEDCEVDPLKFPEEYCNIGRGGNVLDEAAALQVGCRRARTSISSAYSGFRIVLAPAIRGIWTAFENQSTKTEKKVRPPMPSLKTKLVFLPKECSMEFVLVKAGTFMMGKTGTSMMGKTGKTVMGVEDAKPCQVTLTKDFWLGCTEVTQEQYEAVMGNNPSFFKGADLPVEQVTWQEAMAFCKKLTELERQGGRLPEGYEYTLPTEAQWEYARRGGQMMEYWNADNYGGNSMMSWISINSRVNRIGMTHPVGKKKYTILRFYDMSGNVWEWCWDYYGEYAGDATDPSGPERGLCRVARGGGWNSSVSECRPGVRYYNMADTRSNDLGFRVALAPVR